MRRTLVRVSSGSATSPENERVACVRALRQRLAEVGEQSRRAADKQLDLLTPQVVTVRGIGHVSTHAAVQVLGDVHAVLPALGGPPCGGDDGEYGVVTGVERPRSLECS